MTRHGPAAGYPCIKTLEPPTRNEPENSRCVYFIFVLAIRLMKIFFFSKIPALAFAGDASLAALTFSASCAVAGLRTGLDDLAAGYCERVGKGWCDRMGAACAFGFLASMSIVPSAALNTANKCGPW